MGLDALQMRGMEQQAKPDRGYVSSTYAKGRGEVCRREVVVINGASIPPRRPTFTRNTYPRRFQPGPTLALPPLSTRSYLSPPSPDFDPANMNRYPSSRTFFPDRKFSTFVVSPFIFNISPRNFSSFLR